MTAPENPVTSDPDVLSGITCFTGTRVPVAALLDYLQAGDRVDDFLDDFPTVSRDQVEALIIHQEVVLTTDVPADGLRRGDTGTVVHVYPGGGYEVEFFTASGETSAVVTLRQSDVRLLPTASLPAS